MDDAQWLDTANTKRPSRETSETATTPRMDRQPAVDTTHQVQVTGCLDITDTVCIYGGGAPDTPAPLVRFQHLTPTSKYTQTRHLELLTRCPTLNVYARTAPIDFLGTYHPEGAHSLGLFLA